MGSKRNRRSAAEMAEFYRQQAERCQAIAEGRAVDDTEHGVLKALKARLRKTKTEFRSAQITLNGVAREDGHGWTRAPIADKILGTIARLESQRETKRRAEEFIAALPFDVERLEALVAAAEQGEDVEMPGDLVPLSDGQDRSDEEHESAYIAQGENN
ncbi:MAG: hypothetical protein MN733_01730 [Nitrososphaera sp.]|nr:hypothetical protein [Nitrososphaera sp.]